jgi:hypothetical protein
MTSLDDISKMFHIEFEKLDKLINSITPQSELTIHEIIELYYQIINMASMIAMLKQQVDSNYPKSLFAKILETEKIISEKFNLDIHPQIMTKLVNSIHDTTVNLQSSDSTQKTKDDVENEAKRYEELRQKMSTQEFVEQYDKGLSYD